MSSTTGAARAIADVTEGTILASVDIMVPPDRVFAALSDGNEITRWWGAPGVYTTDRWATDFRVGGRYRADGKGADGVPFHVEGEFIEIDPPWRIVQTWEPSWQLDAKTTLRYQLSAIDGGTRLVVRHEGFRGHPESCQGHSDGWIMVLGWLAADLTQAATDEPKYYLAQLRSQRPSFMQDMSADEREMMFRHQVYWRGLQDEGKMLIFGPVADPQGGWGMGILKVSSEEELHRLQNGDPAILGNRGLYYENLPMPRAIYRQL